MQAAPASSKPSKKMKKADGKGLAGKQQGSEQDAAGRLHPGSSAADAGLLAHDTAVQPQYSLFPDTERIENSENLSEHGVVIVPDSDEVQFGWEMSELAALPPNVLTSATVKQELFLELRRTRKRATETLGKQIEHGDGAQQLCLHVGEPPLQLGAALAKLPGGAAASTCPAQGMCIHVSSSNTKPTATYALRKSVDRQPSAGGILH